MEKKSAAIPEELNLEDKVAQVFKENKGLLMGYFLARTQDGAESQDLVSVTITDFWKAMKTLPIPLKDAKHLLFKIARWRIMSYWKWRRDNVSLDESNILSGEHDVVDTGFYKEADLRIIKERIPLMSESLRGIVDMRLSNGISQKEIQEILGMSENAVGVKISRGIKELRKLYEEGPDSIIERYRNGKPKPVTIHE